MKLLKDLSKWILGIALVYFLTEGAYRFYRYEMLMSDNSRGTRSAASSFESPLDILDAQTGFRYKPDSFVHQRLYDADGNLLPHISTINTNNFGLISPDDDATPKPRAEYRIAVLGDSFCATTTSSTTWVTALERDLNGNGAMKKLARKTAFKVLNFCLDGTGVVQWPAVYRYNAQRFHPDFIIVDFIWSHFFSKFTYRDTVNIAGNDYAMISCSSLPATLSNPNCQSASSFVIDPAKEDCRTKSLRIQREIYDQMVRRLPWFSPYPEFLASILKGRFGLQRRLVVRSTSDTVFKNPETAIKASHDALKEIASMQPRMMVLIHPTFEECRDRQMHPVVLQFMEHAKDVDVVNMVNVLSCGTDEAEIIKWYNVPYDMHPSNYGAKIYARAVEGELLTKLTAEKPPQ